MRNLLESLGLLAVFACGFAVSLQRKNASSCPPLRLHNGRTRFRPKTGFMQFQCNRSYLLAGEKYMKCVHGRWDGELPRCVKNTCRKPHDPANGFTYPSHRGAVLNFFCKADYKLNGPAISYCEDGRWTAHLPTCIESARNVSLSCDFEHEDLCGWTHDINHDFDWTRMSHSTPSGHIGTGPKHDHTFGFGGDGHYMYIEATSKSLNDTARLISPTYPRQNNETCLEFYYHMYGSTVGELRVYVHRVKDAWNFQSDDWIAWEYGNKGDRWLRYIVNLGVIDDDFQIIMEGVRGNGYLSDIAIDDVRIIENCSYSDSQETTSITSSVSTEDSIYDYYTCQDRCGYLAGQDDKERCDCDPDCFFRNSCCPDYLPVCIFEPGNYDEVTYNDTTTDYSTADSTTTEPTTQSETTIKATTPKTTKTTTTPTTTKTTTKTTTTAKTTTPTTPRKTPPTKPRRITPKRTLKPPPKPRENEVYKNDVATLPPLNTESFVEVGDKNLLQFVGTTAAYAVFKIETESKTSQTHSFAIFATVAVLAGSIFGVACLLRRRRGCRRGFRSASYGDSQSDVRFLTSDEILDFTLAHPDD